MKHHQRNTRQLLLLVLLLVIVSLACSLIGSGADTEAPNEAPSETATPTPGAGGEVAPTTLSGNKCAGLSGALEMQVLVGPAEAVGLEPVAVGEIPFTVSSENGVDTLQGSGYLSYEDVLTSDWGTYTVYLEMEADLSGTCTGQPGSELLNIALESSGEQMVEVVVEGVQYEYPWSGTHQFDLTFPAEDGATAEGEGWVFVLHLNE